MSGRSAYVRKEKTKVKDVRESGDGHSDRPRDGTGVSISDFPMPMHGRSYDSEYQHGNDISTIKSTGSDDHGLYARVRKPHVPVIEVSGIEKSSFRSVMDKKSESFRKGLSKTFGKKKKAGDLEGRPTTSTTFRPESHELDSGDYIPPPAVVQARQQEQNEPDFARPGPPQTKLPPLPSGPALKQWLGRGRPAQPWNKLRKDIELWDSQGDTYIFLGLPNRQAARREPSFQLSSHAIESTGSAFLISLLQEGATGDANSFGFPPSPLDSPGMRAVQPARQGYQHTPPTSDEGNSPYGNYDGQISYEICFPIPLSMSQTEALRYNVTTRNVFAMLHEASLVGINLYQALNDLTERLDSYMKGTDYVGMIIDYVIAKGFDDFRENPSNAAAFLAWCEGPLVRYEDGWREAFVHCTGMYNRLEPTAEYKLVSHITKALLERKSLEVSVRVQNCEDRLKDFDFLDMWPQLQANSPSRAAFQRLQKFFQQHYRSSYETWPPAVPHGHEQWLHRNLSKKLQADFGALYDYFVNRDILWDGSEERSGRKWYLVNPGDASFQADTADLPFTDILIAFDNLHKYPHIPHPYPLVPDTFPQRSDSKENLLKSKKSAAKPQEDKMAERKAALAYTESTNIYLLGSDFVHNDLVDAFIKFEKSDRAGDNDPSAARRGRWVLVYFILQTLASVSVDTPHIRYSQDVSYHISPKLRGTPPWKGANQNVEEASHIGSHCWTIRSTWAQNEAPATIMASARRTPQHQISIRSAAPSVTSSDAEGSVRSPTMSTASTVGKSRRSHKKDHHNSNEHQLAQYSNFPSHSKGDEWPIKEEGYDLTRPQKEFIIKDFDDYQF
ncbi:hypothetical protein N431DRAFT_80059 [Stipitochalara longipes BDJ]|nr:hypothetical protein N431DRAFT_80059 [Stipitochalara longipes BDJ]